MILLLVVALVGCKQRMSLEEQTRNSFLSKSAAEGAYAGETPVMTYDEYQHQIATNAERLSLRIQNDDQSQYLMLKLSDPPKSVGQMLSIEVQSLAVDGIDAKTYSVEYKKTDMKMMWFWSKTDMVGFVIPVF